MAGFYLSVVVFLFMWLMIFGEGLLRIFLVWFDPSLVDSHVVHNVTFFSLIWVFGLAMLVQLYRPRNRVTTMQLALLIPIVDERVEYSERVKWSTPSFVTGDHGDG